jgi:hypothetical protein
VCGTVGLFVGCAALSYCPRALLGAPPVEPEPESGPDGYRSPFRSWYDRASVRQAPRRVLGPGDEGLLFFAPDLVPVARHPLVTGLPEPAYQEILVQHLYRYLDFTAKLEYLVVNRTVAGIAHGSVGIPLPDEMRLDALKMYCDEGYHALFSVDLAQQVRERTGIRPMLPRTPYFLRRLEETLVELGPDRRALAELLFVIVSETLISASLAEMPNTDDVVPVVRETIRDHAGDEGRHHAYFVIFLRQLWAHLTPDERGWAGRLVPRLLDTFLRPDLDTLRVELGGYGLTRDDTEQVIAEVYAADVLATHGRNASRQVRRYFEEVGAFDDPAARAELVARGFAPTTS